MRGGRVGPIALPNPRRGLTVFRVAVSHLATKNCRFVNVSRFTGTSSRLTVTRHRNRLRHGFRNCAARPRSSLLNFKVASVDVLRSICTRGRGNLQSFCGTVSTSILPVRQNIILDRSSVLHHAIVVRLVYRFRLSGATVRRGCRLQFSRSFSSCFTHRHRSLRVLRTSNLIQLAPGRVRILPTKQLLVHGVTTIFSACLRGGALQRFSRTI